MKRKLFVALCALIISIFAMPAQEPDYSPFFPAPVHEVSISYGLWPASDFVSMFTGVFGDVMDADNRTGTVSLSYINRLNDFVGVGGAFVFAGYSAVSPRPGMPNYKNFYSILPQVKLNWYRSSRITLYSRVGAGVTLIALRGRYSVPDNPQLNKVKAAFAWQLSPVGIEIGRTFALYAEAGFGVTGSAVVGLRCMF